MEMALVEDVGWLGGWFGGWVGLGWVGLGWVGLGWVVGWLVVWVALLHHVVLWWKNSRWLLVISI